MSQTETSSNEIDRTPVEDADVCVVGAGPGGALLAHSLAQEDHDVVVLEAGETFDIDSRVDRMKRDIRPDTPVNEVWDMGGERDEYSASGEHSWPVNKRRVKGVGGTSLHWSGVTPRIIPENFRMESEWGVGRDWPISYDDLQPYYAEAEEEIGVAGDADEAIPPRETEYPMEPLEPSYSDQLFMEAADELGYEVDATPSAINNGTYDRSECQGYGTCQYVCPSGAKYSANIHVEKAIDEGATVIDRVPVQRFEHGPDGEEVTEAVYVTPDGTEHRQEADVFVAAAGAYETPRLLFLSESDQYPDGLANSSGTLGRYVMCHPPAAVVGVLPDRDTYPGTYGPTFSAGIYEFAEHDTADRGSVLIGFLNYAGPQPPGLALDSSAIGDDLFEEVDNQYGHTVGTFMNIEMLPDEDNRITLDESTTDDHGNPVLDVQVSPGEFARNGQEHGIEVSEGLIEELGGNVLFAEGTQTMDHDDAPTNVKGGYHPMGGARMGTDPEESVVNENCRTHDLDNLYISSGSTFVTGGGANPTLTIMALSLRIADHVDENAL